VTAKLNRAQQMLERFALASALHQIAQRSKLVFGKIPLEL